MTVCPIALAAGCRKCPVVSVCPLKGVLGDYDSSESPDADDAPTADTDAPTRRRKKSEP